MIFNFSIALFDFFSVFLLLEGELTLSDLIYVYVKVT